MTNIIKKVIKNGTAYEIFGTAGANINSATATTAGVVKLGSNTSQSVAANSPSSTTGKTYPIQTNGSGQMVVNVPWENTTYESKAAASGGTAVSLVTTGEKYTWNNKQDTLVNQTNIKSVNGYSLLGGGNLSLYSTITVTLTSAGWSSSTQTVTATGVTASNTVIVSPAPSSISDYADGGVYCSSQASNSLTFSCDTEPSNDISVNVLILN